MLYFKVYTKPWFENNNDSEAGPKYVMHATYGNNGFLN